MATSTITETRTTHVLLLWDGGGTTPSESHGRYKRRAQYSRSSKISGTNEAQSTTVVLQSCFLHRRYSSGCWHAVRAEWHVVRMVMP